MLELIATKEPLDAALRRYVAKGILKQGRRIVKANIDSSPATSGFFHFKQKNSRRKNLAGVFNCRSLSAEKLQKKLCTERSIFEGKRRREDCQQPIAKSRENCGEQRENYSVEFYAEHRRVKMRHAQTYRD